MAGLKSAKPYIRRMLAQTVNLRNTPELTFILDQAIEYGVHMTGLIDEVTKELREKEAKEAAQAAETADEEAAEKEADEETEGEEE